jgi:hypothetical protein
MESDQNNQKSINLIGPVNLIKDSVSFYRKFWKKLFLIGVFPQVIVFIVAFVIGALGVFGYQIFDGFSLGTRILFIILGLFIFALIAFANIIQVITMVKSIHSYSVGIELSIKDAFKQSIPLFWSFLLMTIIICLVQLGSATLFVIPGIFIVISSVFYMFVFIIDGKKGFASLVESYRLVKFNWWQVFGRILFLSLCLLVAYIILSIITTPFVLVGLNKVLLSFIASGCLTPIGHVYLYKMYINIKQSTVVNTVSSVYKKWLITFLAIGIVSLISIIWVSFWFLDNYGPAFLG